jgi:hypothetical protein
VKPPHLRNPLDFRAEGDDNSLGSRAPYSLVGVCCRIACKAVICTSQMIVLVNHRRPEVGRCREGVPGMSLDLCTEPNMLASGEPYPEMGTGLGRSC